jgi:hypothetical protein
MICNIYSNKKIVEDDILPKINIVKNKYKYVLNDFKENLNNLTNCGNGFIINKNNTTYIITCYHIVGSVELNNNIFTILYDDKNVEEFIELKIYKSIPEFDISILIFEKSNDENKFSQYQTHDSIVKLNEIEICENFLLKSFDTHFNVSNISIEYHTYVSELLPKIPMILFTDITNNNIVEEENIIEKQNIHDNESFHGLSGSILFSKNKAISMLSYCDDNNIFYTIPICFIMLLLSPTCKINLNGFNIVSQNAFVILENNFYNNKTNFYSKYIASNDNIGYKIFDKKLIFKLKKNDVILKINNIEFNSNGYLFNNNIGYDVDINTFLLIQMFENDYCDFCIVRNIENTEKIIKKKLCGNNLNLLYNVKLFNTYEYIIYKEFIFVEITEELLNKNNFEINMFDTNKKIITINSKTPSILNKFGKSKISSLDELNVAISSGYKTPFFY